MRKNLSSPRKVTKALLFISLGKFGQHMVKVRQYLKDPSSRKNDPIVGSPRM